MIDIADLREEDIGRWVIYTPAHGDTENGRIKSWNNTFVFVVYACAGKWDRFLDFTGCATDSKDLRFMTDEKI
jgi:hypothetical protein